MKPTIIDIVSNVVVRDYIQHWWEVALDIVNLNADGKNKYFLRWEASELILAAIDRYIELYDSNNYRSPYDTIETRLYSLACVLYDRGSIATNSSKCSSEFWVSYIMVLGKITIYLDDKYTRRLNELIDHNNAS